MAGKRLPKEVVARAKELSAPAPRSKPVAVKQAAKEAGAKVREKLVAHLRRLHPMD